MRLDNVFAASLDGFSPASTTAPTSAEAVPVHTSGSGSDGVTVSPSPAICCNCRGWDLLSLFAALLQAAFIDNAGS